jgi:hypothetical protein
MNHVHVEAGTLSILLTLLVYLVRWATGFHLPQILLGLPTFLVLFLGFYLVLYVVFLIAWNR